jgi:hypothetical protein
MFWYLPWKKVNETKGKGKENWGKKEITFESEFAKYPQFAELYTH